MSTPLLQQFPSLSSHPPSFLKDLLSSPQLTEAYLFTLPAVQELAAEIERLGKENEERARRNMELRDDLLALRETTAQSYGHAEALKARWADLDKAQTNLYQRHRPSFLHLRLRHSLTAQDDLSEKLASNFIEGKPSSGQISRTDSPALGGELTTSLPPATVAGGNRAIDEFIQEFKVARKVYHKRAIWAERWTKGEVAWRDD